MTATRVICPSCNQDYAARKDGNPRGHGCDRMPAGPAPVLIPLPWCTPPLRLNTSLRADNPWVKNNRVQVAKGEAVVAIRAARVEPMVGAEITLHYRVPNYRHCDADNLAATLKVCQDALVLAKVLTGDSWHVVPASGQRIHPPHRGVPGAMWLELAAPQQEAS